MSNNNNSERPAATLDDELSEADLNQVVGGKKILVEPIEPVAK